MFIISKLMDWEELVHQPVKLQSFLNLIEMIVMLIMNLELFLLTLISSTIQVIVEILPQL